jgi:hypothetical protein
MMGGGVESPDGRRVKIASPRNPGEKPPDDRYFVAVHEAAHAICHLFFKIPMGGASVVPELPRAILGGQVPNPLKGMARRIEYESHQSLTDRRS